MFPGIMRIHTLAYFYRYTVIKHQHLCPREDRGARGAEAVVAGDDHNLVACPDLRVCRDDMPAKDILPVTGKIRNIREYADPVCRRRDGSHEPAGTGNPERQAPVGGPDCRKPLPRPRLEDLADTPRPGVYKSAAIRKEAASRPSPELVVSNDPDPGERTALR